MNGICNSNLTTRAKELRKNMTKEERRLWYEFLKGLPLTCNRQKVIGNYIVDFYCAGAKLVIEIDGSQHYEEMNKEIDLKRDQYLYSIGLTVKRYSNKDINERFENVCEDIYNFINSNTGFPLRGSCRRKATDEVEQVL